MHTVLGMSPDPDCCLRQRPRVLLTFKWLLALTLLALISPSPHGHPHSACLHPTAPHPQQLLPKLLIQKKRGKNPSSKPVGRECRHQTAGQGLWGCLGKSVCMHVCVCMCVHACTWDIENVCHNRCAMRHCTVEYVCLCTRAKTNENRITKGKWLGTCGRRRIKSWIFKKKEDRAVWPMQSTWRTLLLVSTLKVLSYLRDPLRKPDTPLGQCWASYLYGQT